MDQSLQDLLTQYLGATNALSAQNYPSVLGTYGGLPDSLREAQSQQAIYNLAPIQGATMPTIYVGGGGEYGNGNTPIGGDYVSSNNPFYSYISDISGQQQKLKDAGNPSALIQQNWLDPSSGMSIGNPLINGDSSKILNLATGWQHANSSPDSLAKLNTQLSQNTSGVQSLIDAQTKQNKESEGFFHNPLNIFNALAAVLFPPPLTGLMAAAQGAIQAGQGFSEGDIGKGFGGLISGGLGAANVGGFSPGSYLSNLSGANAGSVLDAGIQGLTGAGIGATTSGLSGGNPLMGAAQGLGSGVLDSQGGIKGILGLNGASNAIEGGPIGSAFGSLYPGPSNVAPSNTGSFQGGSVPLMGTAENSGSNDNYFSNLFGSSSPGISGAANTNISGTQSPSLFDRAASFASENPLTTGAGLLAAGSGIASALDSGGTSSTPSSSIGQGLSSFTPQQSSMAAPNSLANYTNSALSPDQTLSGIATKGVYGGGNGPEEQKYFLNLINNRLVDPTGKVANDMSGINPVENSYLSQLGLGGYQNPNDLLRGISNYAA